MSGSISPRPRATLTALEATKARAAIVGTTGLNAEEEKQIAEVAKRIALVRSGNFSLGVNLLAALVRQAAEKLGPDWDIEIVEAHHRRKIDAPSGTALMLGEAAAAGRGKALSELRLPPREGITGARPEGGIGFSVLRGGGVIGEHDVSFAAEREVLTLSHHALDRAVFADGALAAALWVGGQTARASIRCATCWGFSTPRLARHSAADNASANAARSLGERNAASRIAPPPARINTPRRPRATRAHIGLSTQCVLAPLGSRRST